MPVNSLNPTPASVGPAQFHATAAMLPPGHPVRTAAINHLIQQSFTADPAHAQAIGQQFQQMHLSPDEVRYVRVESAKRGNQAMAAANSGKKSLAGVAGQVAHDVSEAAKATTGINFHAFTHPVERLEARGQFAPSDVVGHDAQGRPIMGYASSVPWFNGPAERLGAETRAAIEHTPRTVTLGEHTTQFPQSPARVTAFTQRHLDRLSERLTGTANTLTESENPIARTAGKAVAKASARARVPIQAGKNLRQEARRAQAGRIGELDALEPSLLKGDGEQIAHFWWAQLPAEYRNVEGLKLVRDKLAEERAALAAKVAGMSGHAPGVRNTPQLQHALEDLQSADANLSKLDKIIAKPPRLEPHVIDAARTLMRDREEALVAAGKLTAETAASRAGLVSRWLGLEPTGEEIYLGHRLQEQRGGILPRGGGLGKTRTPAGVGKQNTLRLVSTGRVRQSMKTAVEDWQRAQAYHFTTTAKDELARMGERIGPEGPKPGHVVVNPLGHTLPRTWKLDEEARAAAEGVKPEDVTLTDLEEYARNTLAAGAARQRLIEAARKAGHAEDLRQIPADVARRYFAQFVPHRVVAGTVPGVVKGASAGRQAVDLIHDLVYSSLIYSNPGYIPANTVANLVMAGLHQGAFLPVNLLRAGQAYFASGAKLRSLLSAEVGMGATRAAASEGRYPGSKVMDFAVGKIAGIPDNVPRISAFMHEAARLGVISKASPILTQKDRAALEALLTDPANRPLLNEIRDRAVQAMVDFERLGAHEKAVAKRFFFVWAWTRGAIRYPLRFALDHPLRSAAIGYAAAGAPGAPQDVQDKLREYMPTVAKGMPSWLHEALNVGHATIGGKTYPTVLPTQSISPLGTPLQVAGTVRDILDGSKSQAEQSILGYLNPAIPAAVNVAGKTDQYGRHTSYLGSLESQAQRLSPAAALIRSELHPHAGGIYPGDATRLGRLERALRVFPVAVDPEQAYKARAREGSVSQAEKDAHTRDAAVQQTAQMVHQLGSVPPEWRARYTRAAGIEADRAIAKAQARRALPKGQHLSAADSYRITMETLHRDGAMTDAQYQQAVAAIPRMTDKELSHWEREAWDQLGPGKILRELRHYYNQRTGK